MTLQMSILTQMNEVSTQMDSTVIQAANQGALSDNDRASLAEQLQGLKDQLVSLATRLMVMVVIFSAVMNQIRRRLKWMRRPAM